MTLCDCGCNHEIGSDEFYLLHIGSPEEVEQMDLMAEAHERDNIEKCLEYQQEVYD